MRECCKWLREFFAVFNLTISTYLIEVTCKAQRMETFQYFEIIDFCGLYAICIFAYWLSYMQRHERHITIEALAERVQA